MTNNNVFTHNATRRPEGEAAQAVLESLKKDELSREEREAWRQGFEGNVYKYRAAVRAGEAI